MFSYYLQDRSYYFAKSEEVEQHLNELNSIVTNADAYDHFLKFRNFQNRPFDKKRSIQDFFCGLSPYIQNRLLPSILRRIKDIDHCYYGLQDMDEECTKTANAFLGPKFSTSSERLLTNQQDYWAFRAYHSTHNVTGKNFGQCCKIALKNVVLLDDAIESVKSIGKEAAQVFDDLFALDQYIENNWKRGTFDVIDAQAKTNFVITNESKTTINNPKFSRTRLYNIPGVGSKYCFIHIKSGNGKRIHLYPDESTRTVYVPFIGLHKTSKKNT